MKKFFAILLLLVCSLSIFASSELFEKNSDEVVLFEYLVRVAGKTMPPAIYPVSGDFLLETIDSLNLENCLQNKDLDDLNALIERLNGSNLFKINDSFAFDPDLLISPFIYLNTGEFHDDSQSDSIIADNDKPAIVKGTASLKLTDYVFGHFEYEYSKYLNKYYQQGFILNSPLGIRNMTAPYNTYLSAGIKHINLYAGRVRVSSGNGITGNLVVGDNFLYRNTIKLGINTFPFTYEFLINSFDPELNQSMQELVPSLDGERPLVLVHKASYTLFDKLTFSFSEGLLDYSAASPFDPKLINPFLLFHNLLSYKYKTNNFFGAEVDWAFAEGWSLHGQLMFDQINLRGEGVKQEPTAWGIVSNVQYAGRTDKENKFKAYFEFAYTSPWAYLKTAHFPYDDYITKYDYHNLDLVVGNFHSVAGQKFDVGYIGYKYGPNTVVLNSGIEWNFPNNKIATDILLKFSGDTGFLYNTDMAVASTHRTKHAHSPFCMEDGHKTQYLIQIKASDEYKFLNGAALLNVSFGLQQYINFRCVKNENSLRSLMSVGVTINPIELFKR